MSEYANRYKRGYIYKSKTIKEGTAHMIKELKNAGKTFEEIGMMYGISKQRVSQIYNKAIAIN